MNIPTIGDDVITFQRLAKALGVHAATIHRWRSVGVVDRSSGERIKLRAVRRGGTWRGSTVDAERCIAALNGEPANAKPDASRSAAAEAELRRLGA